MKFTNGAKVILKLNVNQEKSNVIHCRTPSVQRSSFEFHCGDKLLPTVSHYTCLSLPLTEHLDYDLTATNVAKTANRAKHKAFRDLHSRSFTKLFDTVVWNVTHMGSGIRGSSA